MKVYPGTYEKIARLGQEMDRERMYAQAEAQHNNLLDAVIGLFLEELLENKYEREAIIQVTNRARKAIVKAKGE